MAEVEINKSGRTKRKRRETPAAKPRAAEPTAALPAAAPVNSHLALGVGVAALAIGIFAYWPTIRMRVDAWNREPDYSHGYLVAPLAVLILVLRNMLWGQGVPPFERPSLLV